MKRPKIEFCPRGLELDDWEFEDLHQRLDRAGARAKFTCPVEPLRHLLSDYSRYVAHVDELEARLRRPDPERNP